MNAVYQTLSDAWVSELNKTRLSGTLVAPRGMQTLERTWAQFEVLRPLTFPMRAAGRLFRDAIPVLEALSMIAQTSLATTFTDRVRKFGDFQDDGIFYGSYGARLHGQIGDVVARIKSDPDTRQAVLTIFDGGRDLAAAKKDIPCTIAIQFLLRDDELEMGVRMRSNDLWLGTPYDLVQFSILQATIAQALGVEPGIYAHSAGSLHLYERNFVDADKIASVESYSQMAFPLWGADDLAGIVERAQRILTQDMTDEMRGTLTDFEQWAWASLASS